VAVNELGDYFSGNPAIPSTFPLERRDLERIASLGCSSVRLIVSWSRLEPQPGVYDRQYLEQIKQAVGWAKANGIYVILDMHQDAWGKYIASPPDQKCRWPLLPNIGWDGAPEWATFTDDRNRCMLVHRELSMAVMNSWQAFWENRDGLQDHLADTWAGLAAEFKNEPAVAGYDLLNEPGWGFNPVKDVNQYKPAFYRRCTGAIRKAEAGGLHKIIFFEPLSIWAAIPHEAPKPFTQDPDIIYAPHIYLGSISIDMFLFHREMIPLRKGFEWADGEAKTFGTTFWNGEWMPGPGDHAYRYAALEDEYQTGSARWQWKSSCGDPHAMSGYWPDQTKSPEGSVHSVVVVRCGDASQPEGIEEGINPIDAVVLARPYPRAFPSPATFQSDPKARALEMSGKALTGTAPLLVWVPGKGKPKVETENVRDISLEQVDGGWLLHGLPGPGAWKLFAQGGD
jgi:endoglycosylceramidase